MVASREMMQPIYLGSGRSLIKLPNSRMLCIDGESIDSIDLIMSGEIEPDVVGVFLRYLRPSSVVLDIGANFGYFSTLAGPLLSDAGRLYAFEANPRTFTCLERSLMANYQLGRPNVTATNVAAGESDGETKFYFESKALGGASRYARDLDTTQTVVMPMRSMDSFLPDDLVVDLVKIDVEGYEPYVLNGMRKVLARSPDAKIIVEMFTYMLEATYGMAKFQSLMQELGLSCCRILPDSSLELMPLDRPITGNHYALLTRTPEADIAASKARKVELDSLRLPEHGAQLVGGGMLSWQRGLMRPPHLLFHGPYAFMMPGQYELEITGRLRGPVEFIVQTDLGHQIFGRVMATEFPLSLLFSLKNTTDQLEIVAVVQDDSEMLEISAINIKTRI